MRDGAAVRQEPGEQMSCLELVALPSAPFRARRHTRETLHAWQVSAEAVDTVELLVSELVTNAVCAGQVALEQEPEVGAGHTERISLTLRLLPGVMVIEVTDNNPAPPVLRTAGADAESGRGLMLVDALSKEWGHFFPPSGGKVVFAVAEAELQPMQHDAASKEFSDVKDCRIAPDRPIITELAAGGRMTRRTPHLRAARHQVGSPGSAPGLPGRPIRPRR